ncbi:MAG: Tn7-like element transposition protein TnsE [Methylobacter sp.]
MQSVHIDGVVDDTKIMSIGSLFKKQNGSRWGINLGLFPSQNKTSLTLSNAPVLARKRILNPTAETPSAGYPLSFAIASTEHWQHRTLVDYPIPKAVGSLERKEWCFYFLTDQGVQVFLPQFELARALFFHNAYLSRTALEPDCLNAEFDIQRLGSAVARINILSSSSYPAALLNDYGARRLLSWLLMDEEARRSFESIGRNQKLNGYDKNGYRSWHFQFEPPKLPNVRFDVRGHFDRNEKCMFIYEISGIRNIKANIPGVVEIYHPDFKENVRGQGSGGVRGFPGSPLDHTVCDESEANADHQPVSLSAPPVVFEFAEAFEVRKVAQKKRQAAAGKADQEAGSITASKVSVDEATVTGALPGADWDCVVDETDDVHLYANKFECFQSMLDELCAKNGIVIRSKQLRKLPKLPRCKKHLLTNGNPRCMAVVEVAFNNTLFHILEVDTSDAVNLLSTQVLRLKSQDEWGEQLIKLEKALLKSSLRWPNSLLAEMCGENGGVGVPHPKTDSADKGHLRPDSISHWVARIHARLVAM